MRPVGRGDTGKQVVDIQTRLAALGYFLGDEGADGFFGPHTESAIRAFQQQRLLFADGIVEDNTWTELVEAGYQPGDRLLYLRVPYMRGDDVLYLQRRLDELGFDCGPVDGIFSPLLEVAVTEFQRNAGLNVDGIVGETTLDRMRRLQKVGDEGRLVNIPDRMDGYVGLRLAARAAGEHRPGPRRPGQGRPGAERDEREGRQPRSRQAAGRAARGRRGGGASSCARPTSTCRSTSGPMPPTCGSRTSTSASITPTRPSPKAQGAASYYFANSVYQSKAGKRLAGYIVDALSRELGRVDLRKHGRNYACLREVKPLAVMVEPGFLSNPEEGRAVLPIPRSSPAKPRPYCTASRPIWPGCSGARGRRHPRPGRRPGQLAASARRMV